MSEDEEEAANDSDGVGDFDDLDGGGCFSDKEEYDGGEKCHFKSTADKDDIENGRNIGDKSPMTPSKNIFSP